MLPLATKVFIALNAVVWIGYGPAFYFFTETLAGKLQVTLGGADGLADFRAMYGGIPLGVGALMLSALWRDQWVRPVLVVIAACTGCLMLGRIITLVDPGGVGTFTYAMIALEAVTTLGALLLLRLRQAPGR